ncbi:MULTISPECIES: transglutaminase domain-containing protein [Methanobacterium]|uniref:Glycosyl hydrolase family 18 protein n=1 Tax=Methanobacterium veterum TaxID=408577 RepID=A0A9E5A0C6_9EURY|nr:MULTISPECIES: transglutaminase domain-containing protein [Methanobacterium]MCZ3366833.1 glycosyl hydrolase family 18 protein [Methanobacterium veterum]MCZ3374020.1 glycosyl hydrolase family 18 protein [Methanobacterium veterum]
MKRLLLLIVLLLFVAALFNVTNIYAATEYSQITDNYLNTSLIQENITNNTSNNLTIQNTTESVKKTASVTKTVQNQSLPKNASNSSDSRMKTNNSNITHLQNSTDAAGAELYKNVRGIWLKAEDVNKLNISEIKKAGITDIFIKSNLLSAPSYKSVLTALLNKLKGTNFRVHAWITCFKDVNGNWIDPQGKYSYTVKVPDKKIKYKVWYKSWYKYNGKWKYKWKYYYKYKYTYKYQTKYGYNTSKIDSLISSISKIVKNYNIDGINLDYIRYPGNAYKSSGSTAAVTSFVQKVYNTVKSIKPKVAVSAELMPEGKMNAYYYGQNYTQLAKYLDFMVPMLYKGNYGYNSSTGTNSNGKSGTDWIGSTVKYIVSQANGTPVIAGLQTYRSDKNVKVIPAGELKSDIKSAGNNGASGYALFRYGLIDSKLYTSQNSTGTQIKFTMDQIQDAAARVKAYVETNHVLPNYVTIGTTQVKMPDMLRLMTASLLQLKSGTKTPIALKSTSSPVKPAGDTIDGIINKAGYLKIAQNIKSFIEKNGIAPNYATSSLGKIQYESAIYMYSKILNFYKTKKYLPVYVTMTPGIWNDLPSEMQKYLQPTNNCQSNDPKIKSLASLLTKGITSTHDRGEKIFNWVRDNLGYSFYYNTRYGAVGTLNAKTGNCVDTSHLMIALARSAGIPARYVHGYCKFSSGTIYGHVWAQLYINGKWYDADGISIRNSLGEINNWDKNKSTIEGTYAELPF